MSTPSIGSPIASSDEKVRIKCFLGEDIRVFHVSRRISYHDLSDLLTNYFNRPVELYQYADNEEDRVTIHSSFDMEEAFAVYDHLKSVSQTLPTLKLYLRNASSSSNNNNNRLAQSTPELLREDSVNTPPSYLSDPTLNKKGILINKTTVDTPPLRTPPPSPPHDSPFSSMTPPLRTPPPSPPRKNSVDSLPDNNDNVDYSKDIKDNTPPLRTPPPTPPRSLVSSSEVEDSSEDEAPNSLSQLVDSNPSNNLYAQWKKGHKIGTGGFGDVFQGLNNDTGEFCAIKQLELEGATDEKTKRNLLAYQQEIEIMKKLNHTNIVRYLGTQIDGNIMSIFLEYVGGGSIRSILNKYGPLSENNIRKYTKQILNGLKYLHSNNIVHRDIKGANILVTTEGIVKLADFGCAKIFVGIQSNVKSVLGTPYWMAPEVIRAEGYGRSADVWSLGCTIIEMATLKPPWCNDFGEPAAAMFHIASSNETPQIPEHLSPEAHDFLLRCFKRDPKERPDAVQLLNHTFINGQHLLDILDQQQQQHHPISNNINNNNSPINNISSLTSTSIYSLPTDLLLNIFCYIEPRDHGNVSSVCKTWKGCIQDDMIWRHKTLKRWRKIRKEEHMRWKELYSNLEIHDKYWLKSELVCKSMKGKTHSKCINHVTMFDTMIVTSSDDKKLKIWSTEKQKLVKTLKGHTDSVNCAYIIDNGGQILSGSSDKSIKLWNVKTKKIVKSFEGHTDSVSTLHYANNRLVSGSKDKSILLWDPTTGKLVCTLNGHRGGINAVQYVDSTIISASADNTLKIFDARTEKCTRTIEGHSDEVTCIQFDRDNYTVLSGSADKSIKEWDLRLASQECIHTYSGHTDSVRSISVDANKIISGSQDKTVRIWNRHRDNLEQTLNGHTDSVLSVQHDKKKIVSVGKDKQLRIWSPKEEGNNSVPSTPKLLLKKFM